MSYKSRTGMTAVSVRRAAVDDAAGIAAVHLASWEGAYRGLVPDAWLDARTIEEGRASWHARLTSADRALVHVAESDGLIIGFCGSALPSRDADADEDTAEIAAFYVDPGHWRAGAGRALMAAALGEIAAAGWEVVTLWVFEDNSRARAFYAAGGFAPDGARQRHGPDWAPEIRMRRGLSAGVSAASG